MVISKTPLRISFFGGGTDYPTWYRERGGAVLSTTIDKYSYVTVRYLPPFFEHKNLVVWSQIEKVKEIEEIAHPSVRETLKFLKIRDGLGIHYDGDLPARTGLGSSSAFTVGFLNALHALQGRQVAKRQLALDAIHIEQNLIKENVGSQDQVAAAFGGLNKIEFGGQDEIRVMPVEAEPQRLNLLQEHLMLFFTGFSRTASDIAAEQIKNTPQKTKELGAMRGMVTEAQEILENRASNIEDFGRLLRESWEIKRTLSSQVSNPFIDAVYKKALEAGALGGKLLGAGGGGFLLIFARPDRHLKIKEELQPLRYVPFRFEDLGSQIIHKTV
ncbi:MAG: kinase [Candidatus Sungbacteria bacterium]|nr:kinase [Candidatus Sungbacteria bacterium]